MNLNLSEEDKKKYGDQLTEQMTMPLSNLFGKLFKNLTDLKVYVPKQFKSARDASCIRCSFKTNDGLLFPLAKSFIFINKPTILIRFEDIESVEFERFEPNANSGKFLLLKLLFNIYFISNILFLSLSH